MRLLQNRKKINPAVGGGRVTPSPLWPLRTSIVTREEGRDVGGEKEREREKSFHLTGVPMVCHAGG